MTMLYDIQGFKYDTTKWVPVPEDNESVDPHYVDECDRLDITDRADLDHVAVRSQSSTANVSVGETVEVHLEYVTRRVDEHHGLVDETNTDARRDFEVEIEDPDGNVSTVTKAPVNGEATLSLQPDQTGTWTVRSVLASSQYVDEYDTFEGE